MSSACTTLNVIAGLDPAIPLEQRSRFSKMDGRVKPGHDDPMRCPGIVLLTPA
jgi:hypothetical protein